MKTFLRAATFAFAMGVTGSAYAAQDRLAAALLADCAGDESNCEAALLSLTGSASFRSLSAVERDALIGDLMITVGEKLVNSRSGGQSESRAFTSIANFARSQSSTFPSSISIANLVGNIDPNIEAAAVRASLGAFLNPNGQADPSPFITLENLLISARSRLNQDLSQAAVSGQLTARSVTQLRQASSAS